MRAAHLPTVRNWLLLASRYLLTAGVSFVVYFACIFIFFSVIQLRYPFAVAVAYVITLAVHFSMNRRFTFRSGNPALAGQVARYLATAALNYFVQIAIIYVLYAAWHLNFYFATFVGLLANLAVGFSLLWAWVFAHPAEAAPGVRD